MSEIVKIGLVSVEIVKQPRSIIGKVFYEGAPYEPEYEDAYVLKKLRGKDERDVLAQARAWLAKRTPDKVHRGTCVCGNGVEVMRTETLIQCGACGCVLWRAEPVVATVASKPSAKKPAKKSAKKPPKSSATKKSRA